MESLEICGGKAYIAWHVNFFQISGDILLLRQYIYLLLSWNPHINSIGLLGTQNLIESGPPTEDIAQLLFCPFLYFLLLLLFKLVY